MDIMSLIAPQRCPYCNRLIEGIRESCTECAPILASKPHIETLTGGVLCASAAVYESAAKDAVIRYKYCGYRQYSRPFAMTAARLIREVFRDEKFDYYTAVPFRRMPKGVSFDHTAPIARRAARENGAVFRSVLYQTRDKAFQHDLKFEQRWENVRGLYAVKRESDVRGMRIMLVDDVITSGATLCSCIGVLLKAGAAGIACVTVIY